ncbi:hypothetical protein NMY22_g7430 [Coprinellus aureogranulatus]|nr:hypothetical protein NMY22_g7430 [Coprinellus aureogranulatus]
MPFLLGDPIAWESLFTFMTCRRERFLFYIYQNRKILQFQSRFIDLFIAEVGVTLAFEGLQRCSASSSDSRFSPSFRELVNTLHAHCQSDTDLWSALKAGIFRSGEIEDAFSFPISDWWLPDSPLPTMGSVLMDWEASWISIMGREAASGTADLIGLRETLRGFNRETGVDIARAASMLHMVEEHMDASRKLLNSFRELATS